MSKKQRWRLTRADEQEWEIRFLKWLARSQNRAERKWHGWKKARTNGETAMEDLGIRSWRNRSD